MIFFFFLLGYHKIEEKQKFNALDIVDSLSQEIWSLSYVTLMINIVFFLDVPTLKLTIIIVIILPNDRLERIPPTARTTKK